MKFGIVRFIIAIILLIVIIQVLTTIYFSSTHWPDEHVEIGNHHVGRLHKIRAHVDATQVPGHNNNRSPREEESEKDSKPGVPFVPPCDVKHKDAVSALRRVKSEACKRLIYKTACLSEAKKLYNLNIKRTCPVPREKGSPAKWIDVANTPYGNPIRVAFVITLHGRAFRQVKRLFKAIYHTNHYFFFHIDSRSDYLRREVLKMIRNFPNAAVAPWSMATIWGGASLLKMLLKCMEDLMAEEWKWDFFINLSESDYPIKHNSALVEFLRARRDFNFLKPHGRELARFIKKQGLDRTFLECDEHMWRLGNRSLPPEIDIDGGSDWIALNRKFCHYLVMSKDPLVATLRHMYGYSLLPAESFFHTVLRNGPLCETFIRTNLRLTNWKRKMGCRCQYKHIVDWCGCSPNDFKPEDMPRLKTQNQNYFARKFEAIVNQEVINQLDSWLYGSYPADMKGVNYYWENIFHHEDSITKTSDVFRTFFQSFVRIGITNAKMKSTRGNKDHSCLTGGNGKIREVTVLNQHDQFSGVLALFDVELPSGKGATRVVTMETWMAPLSHEELLNLNMSRGPQRLVGLEVGTIWDQKERVFRNLAHLMGPWDDPVLVHHWVHGKEFDVKIMWVDPINVVTGVYEMKVIDNWVVSFHKPTFKKPMRPGKWTVKMVYTRKGEDMVIGQISFLVIPMTFSKGKAISSQDAMAANSGPPGGIYNSNDFIIEFDREANNTEALAKKAAENSRKSGSDLDDWVDSEVDYFWTVESLCSPNGQIPGCTDIPLCESTIWSSRSPDPKSELGRVNAHGRLR
ncbi:LOW QUALITY PROTEIN: xylosyltransferase 1-like [Acropora millepora]|uniref:LOW QUALITY PROTEIN: xylosyltransferase 1-like n=1 Tax=Acropora millepora TaxID=45264 RepID=UPI001CF5FE94|nr:LOW QUALITY PROTEIN: xylosyltransferase 1-like [Acropora millepora]